MRFRTHGGFACTHALLKNAIHSADAICKPCYLSFVWSGKALKLFLFMNMAFLSLVSRVTACVDDVIWLKEHKQVPALVMFP